MEPLLVFVGALPVAADLCHGGEESLEPFFESAAIQCSIVGKGPESEILHLEITAGCEGVVGFFEDAEVVPEAGD